MELVQKLCVSHAAADRILYWMSPRVPRHVRHSMRCMKSDFTVRNDCAVGMPTLQLLIIAFQLHNLRLYTKIAMFIYAYKFSDASVGLVGFFEILS